MHEYKTLIIYYLLKTKCIYVRIYESIFIIYYNCYAYDCTHKFQNNIILITKILECYFTFVN